MFKKQNPKYRYKDIRILSEGCQKLFLSITQVKTVIKFSLMYYLFSLYIQKTTFQSSGLIKLSQTTKFDFSHDT